MDQATKALIARTFDPSVSWPLLPPVLSLTYVQNTGAAFGILKGQQGLFILLSVLVILWMLRELSTPAGPRPALSWGYALILGGAAGNLLDRLRLGYVIDFIDLRVWPVFNLADSAITIGMARLFLHLVRGQSPRA